MNFQSLKIAQVAFVVLTAISAMEGLGSAAEEAQAPTATASQTVKGEVVMATEELIVVKELDGKGTLVKVDKDTKRNGVIKVGDKVMAQISQDGYAKSVTTSNGAQ